MASYLQIENLNKSFGDLSLFENLSLGINEGDRIGLIAPNGAGKTTLLKIIAGKEDYSSGLITFRRDLKVAILDQDPRFLEGSTVMEACFHGDSPSLQAIAAYEKALTSGDEAELSHAISQMDSLGAWNYESRIKQILGSLRVTDLDQRTDQLSGGQRKRLALATTLIEEPDLLILDEPTNHLDLEMTEWLEKYLISSGITLLMVTHDRYFLDRVCTGIIEIADRRAYRYEGNYSYYLEKRQERLDADAAAHESARNLFRKELDWMRRQPQARATKAKSRIKSFYELEDFLRRERDSGKVRLDVKSSYIGKKIFEIKGMSKSFGDKVILKDFSYLFARYEKMGIIGDNGTGKSTFIKLIMGLVEPDSGTIEIGETVRFGYYSQDGISFDENKKVLDAVTEIAESIDLGGGRTMSASQFLLHFLFPPKTQHNFISKLSGGEKRRLYLCTVLMRNPNFLILDEPTNDLDIMTLQVLEEYLQDFAGCLIVISHDRYFIDKVADHLLVFEGGGRIKDFPSSYTDYLEWKRLRDADAQNEQPKLIKEKPKTEKPQPGERKKLTYAEKKEMERIETELPEREKEKADLETELSSENLDIERLTAKSERIAELIGIIDDLSMRWLELSELEGK